MPELPEVETVRRGLEPVMTGVKLLHVEQRRANLRFAFPPDFVARLEGRTITALERRAKYLLGALDSGEVLMIHLGMSGRFTIIDPTQKQKPGTFHHETGGSSLHDHIVFHLENGARIIYNDPRRFGFMDLVPRAALESCRHFKSMGIEPLGNALHGDHIRAMFEGKKAPLKAALLDQSLIAGLGNIYVCEALYRSGLSPKRRAGTLSSKRGAMQDKAERLADIIRDVLIEAVEAGGSSLRDFAQTDGSLGYF
jgi:formamidopyrimidine-DNA glycosylase